MANRNTYRGGGQGGRKAGVNVDDFMRQYGSGSQSGSQQRSTGSGQQGRTGNGVSVEDFMGQYGPGAKSQGGQQQDRGQDQWGLSASEQQELQGKRQDLLRQLSQVQESAAYITDEMSANANKDAERGLIGQIEDLDKRLGRDAQYYSNADRFRGTLQGAFLGQGASYANAFGTVAQLAGAQDEAGRLIADSAYSGYATDPVAEMNMRAAAESGHAAESAGILETNRRLTESSFKAADDLYGRSTAYIARAKAGTSGLDSLLVDATQGAVDLAADAVLNTLAPGMGQVAMGARAFGSASMEQRLAGGDEGKQLAAGVKSAAIEILTEKIGGPFEKIYGKTLLGKVTSEAIDKVTSKSGRIILKLVSDFFGEGVEEVLSDILNPIADRLMGLSDEDWSFFKDKDFYLNTLYDGLLGGLLGLAGGSVELARQGYAKASAEKRAEIVRQAQEAAVQAVDKAIDGQTGQGQQTETSGQDQAPAPSEALPLPQIAMPDSPRPAQQRVNRMLTQAQDLSQLQQAAQTIQDEPALSAAFRELTGTEIEDYISRLQRQAQEAAEAAPQTQEPPVQQPQVQQAAQQPAPAPAEQTQTPITQPAQPTTQQAQQPSEAPAVQQPSPVAAQPAVQQAQPAVQQQAPSPADVLAQTAQGQQTQQAPAPQAQELTARQEAPAASPADALVQAAIQEQERREAERREAERQEAERREAERMEQERREAERKAAEQREAERLEQERREAERREAGAAAEELKELRERLADGELSLEEAKKRAEEIDRGLKEKGNTVFSEAYDRARLELLQGISNIEESTKKRAREVRATFKDAWRGALSAFRKVGDSVGYAFRLSRTIFDGIEPGLTPGYGAVEDYMRARAAEAAGIVKLRRIRTGGVFELVIPRSESGLDEDSSLSDRLLYSASDVLSVRSEAAARIDEALKEDLGDEFDALRERFAPKLQNLGIATQAQPEASRSSGGTETAPDTRKSGTAQTEVFNSGSAGTETASDGYDVARSQLIEVYRRQIEIARDTQASLRRLNEIGRDIQEETIPDLEESVARLEQSAAEAEAQEDLEKRDGRLAALEEQRGILRFISERRETADTMRAREEQASSLDAKIRELEDKIAALEREAAQTTPAQTLADAASGRETDAKARPYLSFEDILKRGEEYRAEAEKRTAGQPRRVLPEVVQRPSTEKSPASQAESKALYRAARDSREKAAEHRAEVRKQNATAEGIRRAQGSAGVEQTGMTEEQAERIRDISDTAPGLSRKALADRAAAKYHLDDEASRAYGDVVTTGVDSIFEDGRNASRIASGEDEWASVPTSYRLDILNAYVDARALSIAKSANGSDPVLKDPSGDGYLTWEEMSDDQKEGFLPAQYREGFLHYFVRDGEIVRETPEIITPTGKGQNRETDRYSAEFARLGITDAPGRTGKPKPTVKAEMETSRIEELKKKLPRPWDFYVKGAKKEIARSIKSAPEGQKRSGLEYAAKRILTGDGDFGDLPVVLRSEVLAEAQGIDSAYRRDAMAQDMELRADWKHDPDQADIPEGFTYHGEFIPYSDADLAARVEAQDRSNANKHRKNYEKWLERKYGGKAISGGAYGTPRIDIRSDLAQRVMRSRQLLDDMIAGTGSFANFSASNRLDLLRSIYPDANWQFDGSTNSISLPAEKAKRSDDAFKFRRAPKQKDYTVKGGTASGKQAQKAGPGGPATGSERIVSEQDLANSARVSGRDGLVRDTGVDTEGRSGSSSEEAQAAGSGGDLTGAPVLSSEEELAAWRDGLKYAADELGAKPVGVLTPEMQRVKDHAGKLGVPVTFLSRFDSKPSERFKHRIAFCWRPGGGVFLTFGKETKTNIAKILHHEVVHFFVKKRSNGRADQGGIFGVKMLKSSGLSVEDIAAAGAVYRRAYQDGYSQDTFGKSYKELSPSEQRFVSYLVAEEMLCDAVAGVSEKYELAGITAEQIDALRKHALDMCVESGLITEEQRAEMERFSSEEIADDLLPELADEAKQTEQKAEDSQQPKAPRKPRSSTKSEVDKQAGQARGDWRLGSAAAKKLDAEYQAEQDALWQEAEKRWQAEHEGFSPDVEADDWESDDLPPLPPTQEDTVSEEDAAMEEILRDRDAMRKEYADRRRRQREEQRQKQQQERTETLDEISQEALDRERTAEQAAENEARQQREDRREAEEAEYVPEERPSVSVEAIGEQAFGELTSIAKRLQEHVKVITKDEDGKDITEYGPFASTFKPLADAFQGMLDGKNGFKEVYEAYRNLSEPGHSTYGAGFQDKALLKQLSSLSHAFETGKAFEKGTGGELVMKKEYADRLVRLTKQMVFRFGRLERSFESRPELKKEFDMAGHSEKGANGFLDILNRLQLRTSTAFKRLAGFDSQSGKQLYKLADKVDSSVLQAINIEQAAQEYMAKATGMKGFKDFSRGKTSIKNIVPGLSYGDRLSSNMALSLVMTLETEGAIDHIVDGGQLEMPRTEGEYFGGKNDAGYGEKGGHALRFDPLQQSTRERLMLAKNAEESRIAREEATKELQKLAEDMKTELFKDPVAKAAYEATAPLMYFMKRTLNKAGRVVWGVDVAHGTDHYYPLEKMGSQYRSGLFADEMPSFDTFSNVQERTGGSSGLRIRSYTEVIQHYISASSRWAAFSDLADTLDMMTRNFGPEEGSFSSLTQLAQANLGKGWAYWIEDYVNDLNGVRKGDKDNPGQKFANWMRSAIASASLAANIGVALKQMPSGFTFMSVVDPDLVAKNFIGSTLRSNKSFAADALVQAVGGHSRLLASRMAGLSSIEVGEMLQSGRKFKLPGWMSGLITSADFHTVASGLMACADQIDRRIDNGQLSLKKGSDAYYQAVSDLFEEAVLHTQPIYNREARAAMNRSSSEYLRTAAMFTTQPNQNYNTLVETIGEWNAARRSGDKDRIKAAVKPMVRTIVGQSLSAMFFSALNTMVQLGLHKRKQYEDEEGNLDWGKVAALTGYNFVNTVLSTSWVLRMVAPLAIDMVTSWLNKADKDIPKSSIYFGTEDSIFGKISDVFTSLKTFNEKPTLKAGKNFVTAVTSAFGIPSQNVYNLFNTAVMYGMDGYGLNPKNEDDFVTWLDKYYNSGSNSRGKQAMARALMLDAKGHTEQADRILSSLDYTDEKLMEGAKTELKDQFVLGQISERQYRDIMKRYLGMDSKAIQAAIDAAEKKRELNETAERAAAKSPKAWETAEQTLKDGSWTNDPTGQTRMQAILDLDMSPKDTVVLVSSYMGKDYTTGFTALLNSGKSSAEAASIMQAISADGNGRPTQSEIYSWYKANPTRSGVARTVWNAYNDKTSFNDYLDKMRRDPVEILMSSGMSEDKAASIKDAIDVNGKSGFSQDELWDYYLAHPSMESIIEELWASRGWTKSWEEYKKKHGK